MSSRDRVMARFWDLEDSREPGATREEIDRTESIVGCLLPSELRELLMVRNGGLSNYDTFRGRGVEHPLLVMFSADPDGDFDSIVAAFDVRAEFGVPDGVVPFAGEGHSWWGLDYRVTGGPGVVFKWNDNEVEAVASSFEAFLRGLVKAW